MGYLSEKARIYFWMRLYLHRYSIGWSRFFIRWRKKQRTRKIQICFEAESEKLCGSKRHCVYSGTKRPTALFSDPLPDYAVYYQINHGAASGIVGRPFYWNQQVLYIRTGPYCLFPKRRERNGGCYGQWNEVFIANQKIPDIM